jgi:hypothetical protein
MFDVSVPVDIGLPVGDRPRIDDRRLVCVSECMRVNDERPRARNTTVKAPTRPSGERAVAGDPVRLVA